VCHVFSRFLVTLSPCFLPFQIQFHPTEQTRVITACEDGLICYFDTAVSGEEDALICVMNAESAPRRVGFFGANMDSLYCLTGTETFTLWDLVTATTIADHSQLRDTMKQSVSVRLNVDHRLIHFLLQINVVADYFVDCQYNEQSQILTLGSGNFDGDFHLSTVELDAVLPVASFTGGHNECIRDFSLRNGHVMTTGEDARVCLWQAP
jgi:hypothetical protein